MLRKVGIIIVFVLYGFLPFQLYGASDNIATDAWVTVSDSLNSETGARKLVDGKIMYDG